VLPTTPLLLSVIVSVALRVPTAVGSNDRLMVQLDPAETGELVEQVVPPAAKEKSPLSAPAMATLEIVKPALPLFDKVTDMVGPGVPTSCPAKLRLPGDRLTAGAIPVPKVLTDCVLPGTPPLLSVMVSVPLIEPVNVGVKVTLIEQLSPTATAAPQVLV
jgi:hypothetical protein